AATPMIVEAMLDVKKRSATSNLSEISGLTGLAPAGPIKEEEVDYSCLEWGDMDPAYRRELEQKPEVKKALQNFKRQAKAARLTPSGEFVEPNLEIPTPNNPPSLDEELKQVEITGSSLETALKSYHERHVQPSFNMLADALTAVSNKKAPSVLRALNLHQMQLSNLEGEICHRTVILHNVPPFANYKSIQGNMRYLCQAASMDFHEDAFHMFPYAIEYHALDAALADKLCSDPGFIHKGYGGLGQVVNTAQAARGIDPLDFGRNPRASISAKAGGKGKGGRKGKARLADQSGHRGSFGEVNLDSGEFRTDYGRGDRDHRKRDWADYEVED
ncbi:unnamed protein product, partial [Symbiodinium sp. KB8]